MLETLRDIVDRIVKIESSISSSLFLAIEYPNNKEYSEIYKKDSSKLRDLYTEIYKLQEAYTISRLLSDID